MTDIESKIIEMLNDGHSYSTIQEVLKVSSKTISSIKRTYMESAESSNSTLFSTSHNVEPTSNIKPLHQESIKTDDCLPNNKSIKNENNMTENNSEYDNNVHESNQNVREYDHPSQVFDPSVEMLRLQLEHEREMHKLGTLRDKEDRELFLREREFQLKRDQFDLLQRQKSEELRILLFGIKNLSSKCEDGEYSYEEAESLLDEAENMLTECEKYCFVNEMSFENTESKKILQEIISALSTFLESTDENDSADIEFNANLKKMIKKANFLKF